MCQLVEMSSGILLIGICVVFWVFQVHAELADGISVIYRIYRQYCVVFEVLQIYVMYIYWIEGCEMIEGCGYLIGILIRILNRSISSTDL